MMRDLFNGSDNDGDNEAEPQGVVGEFFVTDMDHMHLACSHSEAKLEYTSHVVTENHRVAGNIGVWRSRNPQ